VNHLVAKGYLVQRQIVGGTWIGIKPNHIHKNIEWDLNAFKDLRLQILQQYEQLTGPGSRGTPCVEN